MVSKGYKENVELADRPPSYEEVVHEETDRELNEAGEERDVEGGDVASGSQGPMDKKPDVRKILLSGEVPSATSTACYANSRL